MTARFFSAAMSPLPKPWNPSRMTLAMASTSPVRGSMTMETADLPPVSRNVFSSTSSA